MSERSAAVTLFPNLPSGSAPAQDRALPAPDRPAAESVYGRSPNAGLDVAKAVTESGVAKPASETEPDGASNEKGEILTAKTERSTTPFDASKFEGADPGLIADFGKIAGKANISHETAGELMNLHTQASERYWTERQTAWEKQVHADKEIGGERLTTEVVPAVKELLANRDLIDPEVVSLLNTYRLGSHPAIIRSLYRIAMAL